MLVYPVEFELDTNGTVLVTFPDVPEAVTFGDDEKRRKISGNRYADRHVLRVHGRPADDSHAQPS